MEEYQNKTNTLKEEIEKNIVIPLKTRKKPKGCSRFLRNVIKDKAKVMKEILQNRFFKWRKDALKGKIKKTIMIRISVSREKDPKSKYLISKDKPKELPKSINKNDIRSINMNNPSQNINDIKAPRSNIFNKENNNINIKGKEVNQNVKENKNILDKNPKKNENQIYKVINTSNKNEIQPSKDSNNNKPIPYIKINNYERNKIDKKNEIPKITPRINKTIQPYSSNTQRPNQYNQKNISQDFNKTPLLNNNNVSIVYTSSTKKSNINDQKIVKENNYRYINNKNEIKNKIPIGNYKKYEVHNTHNTTLPLKDVKVDLTKDKYYNNTFNNRKNKDEHTYTNLGYDKNKLLNNNNNIYNNNTYQRKTNNAENKSLYNYIVKKENNNNNIMNNNNYNSLSYTRPKKEGNKTPGPLSIRKNSKGGVTTVIQHYSGQRREFENYDMNNDENNNKK